MVGHLLMVPAILLGLVRIPPGLLYRVFDGWPILTGWGIGVVYVVPALVIGVLSNWRRDAPGGP
jgi:hypothetical protein